MNEPRGFNLTTYRKMLTRALDVGYSFCFFDGIGQERGPRNCLLRHDVDSEIVGCGPMLDVERDLGVRATYFLMTRSSAYNLFSVEGRQMVERILADGHQIGLHFFAERYEGRSADDISEGILREIAWLRMEFGVPVAAMAFHQPSAYMLNLELSIRGLINTYNRNQLRNYFYVSDTNMQWRHEHPLDMFSKRTHDNIQLLVHPMWWVYGDRPIADKWLSVIEANQRSLIEHWHRRERTLANIDLYSALHKKAVAYPPLKSS